EWRAESQGIERVRVMGSQLRGLLSWTDLGRRFNVPRTPPGLAVLDIMAVSMPEIGQQHLIDCQIGSRSGHRSGEPSAVREPLRDEPVILGPAPRGVVASEVDVSAVECDDSLVRRPVKTIGGGAKTWGGEYGPISNPVDYRLSRSSWGAPPRGRASCKSSLRRDLNQARPVGFEPTTFGFEVRDSIH